MHPAVRDRLLPGGVLYVTGTLLLEPVKSHYSEVYGEISVHLKPAAGVSDAALQLIGLTLLVGALLQALAPQAGSVLVVFDRGTPPGP